MTAMRVRPFAGPDFAACFALANTLDPDHPRSVSEAARDDASWNVAHYHRSRYVAEQEDGTILGCGEIAHLPRNFLFLRTNSTAVNTRMLGINAALGFQPLPARIILELPLA